MESEKSHKRPRTQSPINRMHGINEHFNNPYDIYITKSQFQQQSEMHGIQSVDSHKKLIYPSDKKHTSYAMSHVRSQIQLSQMRIPSPVHESSPYQQNFKKLQTPLSIQTSPFHQILPKRPRLIHPDNVVMTTSVESNNRLKDNSYRPEVEAISPTGSQDDFSKDQDIRHSKEEILLNLTKVDREIAKIEQSISKMQKNKEQLEEQSENPPTEKSELVAIPVEIRQQSLSQIIYSENQQKAKESHLLLSKLGPLISLPLYHQPYDTDIYFTNKEKFLSFKKYLCGFLRRKKQDEHNRIIGLRDRYNILMDEWMDKLNKLENNSKKKAKDAKTRECFEKFFPEVRKQREDRERIIHRSSSVLNRLNCTRTEGTCEQPFEGLNEIETEEKKRYSLAINPPILLDEAQKRLRYLNDNGRLCVGSTPSEVSMASQALVTAAGMLKAAYWAPDEKYIFKQKYIIHPKNFALIASYLENKTVQDCVAFYYASKKSENYKKLVRNHASRNKNRNIKKQQPKELNDVSTSLSSSINNISKNDEKIIESDDSKANTNMDSIDSKLPINILENYNGDIKLTNVKPSMTESTGADKFPDNMDVNAPLETNPVNTKLISEDNHFTKSETESIEFNNKCVANTVEPDLLPLTSIKSEIITPYYPAATDSRSSNDNFILINSSIIKKEPFLVTMEMRSADKNYIDYREEIESVTLKNNALDTSLVPIDTSAIHAAPFETILKNDFENIDKCRQECYICKLEHDVTRQITQSNCHLFNLKVDDLKENMRVCNQCRLHIFKKKKTVKCPLAVCKMGNRNIKRLKNITSKFFSLSEEIKSKLKQEFKIECFSTELKCCSSCFTRISIFISNILSKQQAKERDESDSKMGDYRRAERNLGDDYAHSTITQQNDMLDDNHTSPVVNHCDNNTLEVGGQSTVLKTGIQSESILVIQDSYNSRNALCEELVIKHPICATGSVEVTKSDDITNTNSPLQKPMILSSNEVINDTKMLLKKDISNNKINDDLKYDEVKILELTQKFDSGGMNEQLRPASNQNKINVITLNASEFNIPTKTPVTNNSTNQIQYFSSTPLTILNQSITVSHLINDQMPSLSVIQENKVSLNPISLRINSPKKEVDRMEENQNFNNYMDSDSLILKNVNEINAYNLPHIKPQNSFQLKCSTINRAQNSLLSNSQNNLSSSNNEVRTIAQISTVIAGQPNQITSLSHNKIFRQGYIEDSNSINKTQPDLHVIMKNDMLNIPELSNTETNKASNLLIIEDSKNMSNNNGLLVRKNYKGQNISCEEMNQKECCNDLNTNEGSIIKMDGGTLSRRSMEGPIIRSNVETGLITKTNMDGSIIRTNIDGSKCRTNIDFCGSIMKGTPRSGLKRPFEVEGESYQQALYYRMNHEESQHEINTRLLAEDFTTAQKMQQSPPSQKIGYSPNSVINFEKIKPKDGYLHPPHLDKMPRTPNFQQNQLHNIASSSLNILPISLISVNSKISSSNFHNAASSHNISANSHQHNSPHSYILNQNIHLSPHNLTNASHILSNPNAQRLIGQNLIYNAGTAISAATLLQNIYASSSETNAHINYMQISPSNTNTYISKTQSLLTIVSPNLTSGHHSKNNVQITMPTGTFSPQGSKYDLQNSLSKYSVQNIQVGPYSTQEDAFSSVQSGIYSMHANTHSNEFSGRMVNQGLIEDFGRYVVEHKDEAARIISKNESNMYNKNNKQKMFHMSHLLPHQGVILVPQVSSPDVTRGRKHRDHRDDRGNNWIDRDNNLGESRTKIKDDVGLSQTNDTFGPISSDYCNENRTSENTKKNESNSHEINCFKNFAPFPRHRQISPLEKISPGPYKLKNLGIYDSCFNSVNQSGQNPMAGGDGHHVAHHKQINALNLPYIKELSNEYANRMSESRFDSNKNS